MPLFCFPRGSPPVVSHAINRVDIEEKLDLVTDVHQHVQLDYWEKRDDCEVGHIDASQ
jgi:hypothetical protein